MQIKDKISILFISIVALIMGAATLAIYYLSAVYRQDEFYDRLYNKAQNTATLLIEVDEVNAELLKRLELNNPSSLPNEETAIYNSRDTLIYSTNGYFALGIENKLLKSIQRGNEERFKVEDREVLGFLFKGQYGQFVVITGATDIYGISKLNNLRIVLFTVFGSSIIITFIFGRIFARRALLPINKVITQVDEINILNLNARLNEGNKKDEIARLAQTFNRMLDRLESAFKLQKNFIANASHELRTPLTAITGQLEVTLLTKRTDTEYLNTISSVLDDMKSLNNLSNRLLLLAQANADNSESGFAMVRFDEIIWQAVSDLNKREPAYLIEVDLHSSLEEKQLTIHANETLIRTVLINLLDNACKYSANHKACLRVFANPSALQIQVIDHGIGISEEDQFLIFEPFHRGKNTQNIKGHGIGLSLVQRIVLLHKGTIRVESAIATGSVFSISLPFNS